MPESNDARRMLRHTLATLAYRGSKAVRDAPDTFASLSIGGGARTPVQILGHIADLMEWGLSMAQGQQRWPASEAESWDRTVGRFYDGLAAFDAYLATDAPLHEASERLFQGPIADALTHVGQLTLLRRLGDTPVRGENYFVADIETGSVGADQAAPRREFD